MHGEKRSSKGNGIREIELWLSDYMVWWGIWGTASSIFISGDINFSKNNRKISGDGRMGRRDAEWLVDIAEGMIDMVETLV
jgi:hypothetical protein